MTIFRRICFANLFALSSAFGQSTVGVLQGLVTNQQGQPIAGADVRYTRVYKVATPSPPSVTVVPNPLPPPPSNPPAIPVFPVVPNLPNGQPALQGTASGSAQGGPELSHLNTSPAPGEAVVQGQLLTGASGSFTAGGLPTGDYLLCANVPSTAYLDSCQWYGTVRVTVAASATSNQNLVLQKGVFLNVRVNDPVGLLTQNGLSGAGNLVVGVNFGSGAYLGAATTEVDAAGRNYQIAVPAGVPLQLWLSSSQVTLTDAGGKPIDTSGALVPFQATAGNDQAFTFAVSGPAAAQAQ
jgi:hypothetical protein